MMILLWFLQVQQQQQQQVVQEVASPQQQQQSVGSGASPGAVHVQMLDSQQIIKYEIIEAPSPTGGNGTNTVTVSTGQHIGSITPTSASSVVVVGNSNGGSADGNGSDQMDWGGGGRRGRWWWWRWFMKPYFAGHVTMTWLITSILLIYYYYYYEIKDEELGFSYQLLGEWECGGGERERYIEGNCWSNHIWVFKRGGASEWIEIIAEQGQQTDELC